MRISEKTVELNFCKGLPLALGKDLMWFGLTQKQEAKAGFDACAAFGAMLLLFQVKASRVILKNGSRRFIAEHDQMQILRSQVTPNRRVFYVLPVAGTTTDFCGGLCFSHCSRYLDLSQLPLTIPLPFAKGKVPLTVRKSNCHYLDMDASLKKAIIHSEPFEAALLTSRDLANTLNLATGELDSSWIEQNPVHGARVPAKTSGEFEGFWHSLSQVDRAGLLGAFAV